MNTLCSGCDRTLAEVPQFVIAVARRTPGKSHSVSSNNIIVGLCDDCANSAVFPTRELAEAIRTTLKGTT